MTVNNTDTELCPICIPGPTALEAYELVHGDKQDTASKEAKLDALFQDFRARIDSLAPRDKTSLDQSIDKLLCDARQIYPDYPNTQS